MKKSQSVGKSSKALPTWKTKWPRNGDLSSWYRCGIEKCKAISDIELASEEAQSPIKALAELGHTKEALKYVRAFLKRLPRTDEYSVEILRMAELGALICMMDDDSSGLESFLAIATKCDELVTRKCDLNWASQSVREFRINHGLLDPADANDKERLAATFNFSKRILRDSLNRADRATARKMLENMLNCIKVLKGDAWKKSQWLLEAIPMAKSLGVQKQITASIESLPANQRRQLGYELLAEARLKQDAIACAVAELNENLRELKTMDDPNIHFPVMNIERALAFLIEINEKELARQWFGKVASSAKNWKCVIRGWVTSAVLTTFVPIVAKLEGKAAAKELARLSFEHASQDANNIFKSGAVDDAISAVAFTGATEEAISAARKLRSPTERREQLAKLFARAGRWKELREVCQQVMSPEEAAELAWSIKFELPGGQED